MNQGPANRRRWAVCLEGAPTDLEVWHQRMPACADPYIEKTSFDGQEHYLLVSTSINSASDTQDDPNRHPPNGHPMAFTEAKAFIFAWLQAAVDLVPSQHTE
jgi:hypothetical protein